MVALLLVLALVLALRQTINVHTHDGPHVNHVHNMHHKPCYALH